MILSVGNNLFLGFWTAESIHGFSEGDYIAVYTGLGVAQGIFMFILSFTFKYVCNVLHAHKAVTHEILAVLLVLLPV